MSEASGYELRLKLAEIVQRCEQAMDDEDRINNYASPCCDCGLYEVLPLKIYLPCDEDTAFGAGEFVIPIKPCDLILLMAEQLEENKRLFFKG